MQNHNNMNTLQSLESLFNLDVIEKYEFYQVLNDDLTSVFIYDPLEKNDRLTLVAKKDAKGTCSFALTPTSALVYVSSRTELPWPVDTNYIIVHRGNDDLTIGELVNRGSYDEITTDKAIAFLESMQASGSIIYLSGISHEPNTEEAFQEKAEAQGFTTSFIYSKDPLYINGY